MKHKEKIIEANLDERQKERQKENILEIEKKKFRSYKAQKKTIETNLNERNWEPNVRNLFNSLFCLTACQLMPKFHVPLHFLHSFIFLCLRIWTLFDQIVI